MAKTEWYKVKMDGLEMLRMDELDQKPLIRFWELSHIDKFRQWSCKNDKHPTKYGSILLRFFDLNLQ